MEKPKTIPESQEAHLIGRIKIELYQINFINLES